MIAFDIFLLLPPSSSSLPLIFISKGSYNPMEISNYLTKDQIAPANNINLIEFAKYHGYILENGSRRALLLSRLAVFTFSGQQQVLPRPYPRRSHRLCDAIYADGFWRGCCVFSGDYLVIIKVSMVGIWGLLIKEGHSFMIASHIIISAAACTPGCFHLRPYIDRHAWADS